MATNSLNFSKQKIVGHLFKWSAILIGIYPLVYFLIDRKFGLLRFKDEALLHHIYWNIAFYTHIILGGIALITGVFQFNKQLREKKLVLHKALGRIYVYAVLLSGLAGLYVAFYATGGSISTWGFSILALFWETSTILAFVYAMRHDIQRHRQWMIYSYAACFAAVTLRIWLPILVPIFGDFIKAYQVVAWLCWLPNLVLAYFIGKKNSV